MPNDNFFFRHEFQGVLEVRYGPLMAGDGAGRRVARVLVVSHEAQEIDSGADAFEVVSRAPIGEDPLGKAAFAGVSGRVRHGGDGKLQPGFMHGLRGFGDQNGEGIAVGLDDVFEIELKADIALLPRFGGDGGNHFPAGGGVRNQLVEVVLIETGIHDNRHHGDAEAPGRIHHLRIRAAGNASGGVHVVPGWDEDIDLAGVLQKRCDAVGVGGQVEKRLGAGAQSGGGQQENTEQAAHGF